MAGIIEFSRGDGAHHGFHIPADAWSPGGRLYFAAKPAIDDDNTDAESLVNGNWGDGNVTDVIRNGIAYKRYDCYFPGSATNNIESDGADIIELLGEFQFVPSSGDPITFPANNEKLDCKVYMDVKRKTVV